MTPELKIQNLCAMADRNQYEIANLKARVDALCEQMNKFTAEMQSHIVTLLQQSGQDIKITDDRGTSPIIPEGEKN